MSQSRGQTVAVIAGVLSIAVIGVALLFVFSGQRSTSVPERVVDLEGAWTVVLASGPRQRIRLTALGDDKYRFDRLVFAGEYELRGDRLVIVKPRDRRMIGLVWKVGEDDSLELIAEPPSLPTGASYSGAWMTRETESPSSPAKKTLRRL